VTFFVQKIQMIFMMYFCFIRIMIKAYYLIYNLLVSVKYEVYIVPKDTLY